MSMTFELDLDILLLYLHAKTQVSTSERLVVRVVTHRRTHDVRTITSEHVTQTWGVKIEPTVGSAGFLFRFEKLQFTRMGIEMTLDTTFLAFTRINTRIIKWHTSLVLLYQEQPATVKCTDYNSSVREHILNHMLCYKGSLYQGYFTF